MARPSPATNASTNEARFRARRTLDRLAFGPAPGETEQLVDVGAEPWIRAALRRPDPPLPELPVGQRDAGSLVREMRAMDDRKERRRMSRALGVALSGNRLERALDAPAPLHERMVDFWANHFAIFVRKGIEPALLPSFERDVLRRHALGSFGDLLLASARHPAMLFYLDNWKSAAPREATGHRSRRRPTGLNENYARELLELHTLGVHGGYDQRDVEEVARAFTGWTLDRPRGTARMRFEPSWHDDGPKTVLGTRLPAGGGVRDGERVIDLLATHPSTARHLARKLAMRFVADDPSEALVKRTAERFLHTGGDLRATLESLLLDGPELFERASVKVKTPFELVVSTLRATGGRITDREAVLRLLGRLSHVPYLAPTPAGYPDDAAHWIDPGALLERTRFAFRVGADRVRGVRFPRLDATRLEEVLPPEVGAATRSALSTPGLAAGERLALALASPEFQLR